jgi:hypothetical protein
MSSWKCAACGILVDRDSSRNPDLCSDVAANAKWRKGLGAKCSRCGKVEKAHFPGTFCNKNPYRLRLGASTCCNCWWGDDEKESFKEYACQHCKARRDFLDTGGFKGAFHVTVVRLHTHTHTHTHTRTGTTYCLKDRRWFN